MHTKQNIYICIRVQHGTHTNSRYFLPATINKLFKLFNLQQCREWKLNILLKDSCNLAACSFTCRCANAVSCLLHT